MINKRSDKLLITGGCSFTDPGHSWAYQTAKKCNFGIENVALASQGNGLISRKLLHKLENLPYSYSSDELIVGVMWSGINRYERFIESGDEYIGPPYLNYNPSWIITPDQRNWRIMSHEWVRSEDCSIHYGTFNNIISSTVLTLEHILRVQWYLDICNIKYFMSTFMDIFSDQEVMNHPEVKYLYEMVDFSKFLPIKGFFEWNKEHHIKEGFDNLELDWHPNKFGHMKLTDDVIIPHLLKNNIIQ
jgi:hypothetical protein